MTVSETQRRWRNNPPGSPWTPRFRLPMTRNDPEKVNEITPTIALSRSLG